MTEPPFTSASFYQFLNQHRLMGSRCAKDGQVYLPPRAMCPADFGADMEWVELSGRGTLAAFSIIAIGPSPMIAAGYDRQNPYCAAIIALDEGPQISAQLLGVDVHHPDTIQIGMPVMVEFVERGEQAFLAFRPVVPGGFNPQASPLPSISITHPGPRTNKRNLHPR